jgi:hypothetical protein
MSTAATIIAPQVLSSYWAAVSPLNGWIYTDYTGSIALWCVALSAVHASATPRARHAPHPCPPLRAPPRVRRVAFACTLFSAVVFLFL